MKVVATAVLAAALFVLPTGAFAAKKRVYVEQGSYAPAPPPAPVACPPAPCAPVCAPACSTPCFNPFSIVGGIVGGVGCAISSVGAGISGIFGSCNNSCAPAPCGPCGY